MKEEFHQRLVVLDFVNSCDLPASWLILARSRLSSSVDILAMEDWCEVRYRVSIRVKVAG